MTDPTAAPGGSINRRRFIQRSGVTGALLAGGNLLAACGVKKDDSGGDNDSADTFTIGLVTPRTGGASGFGEVDPYILGLVKEATKDGVKGGDGKTYKIRIVAKDSQSSPTVAAQVAADLINSTHIDLMLASSTPEVVNPVADACEAAGVPCISTVLPWQAWYYGRGGSKPTQRAFRSTRPPTSSPTTSRSASRRSRARISRRGSRCRPTSGSAPLPQRRGRQRDACGLPGT